MFNLKIILFLLLNTIIYANILNVDDKTKFYDLLPSSQIYIDKTKSLTIDDIKNKNITFKDNDKKLLGFGYSPDFSVWIKFTLKNNTNKTINKILEYDNSLTTNIKIFDITSKQIVQDGLFYINEDRKTINPIYKIKLTPNESKIFYIKVSSHITTLIIKLNLWDIDNFYKKELKHQFILALFFGAMLVLAIYNLFIYFFTKDISYLYYVLYILGIIAHHSIYVGVANIYVLNQIQINIIIEFASLLVAFPVLVFGLFTKSFLQVTQYPTYNKILNIFLFIIPTSIIIFIVSDDFDKYRNLISLSFAIYLMILTVYSALRKNRQAYFILFGWCILFVAYIFMYLSREGIFNIYIHYPYLIETVFVLEAIIFSIALSDRIKQLQKDKEEVNKKLILQQQNEKERLEIKVLEKTNDLKTALDEKGLLLKELNHRVKNNMQTIVSLIKLQNDKIEDKKIQDIFITIQNRINAMSHLHELLYQQDNIEYVNAYEYFDILIEELKDSYNKSINIKFNIHAELKMEQAIYCGLILNELVSNSFKYAFPNNAGTININLDKNNGTFILYITDDGIGYNSNLNNHSLGLTIVDTLTKEQLGGNIEVESLNGVKVKITWSNSNNDKN